MLNKELEELTVKKVKNIPRLLTLYSALACD
jgi:hypothetical protein